jgi:DnaJ-class molecular chaperone
MTTAASAGTNRAGCGCTVCRSCSGTGNIAVDDPMASEGWDLETCPDCGGRGVDECDQCAQERRDYEDEFYG